ncbi:hypothetical protein MWU65_02105 [Cellulophaga sp. F20128]|nr:hypothetical protein [Cellulophaga sp. F20128]
MFKEITLAQGVAHDTVALNKHIENRILPALDIMLDPRKIVRSPQKHSYTFEDSIINHQIKRHPLDENREVTVINRSTGKQRNYTLQDSILVLDEFTFSVPIKDSNEDLKIYEYREIRKNIMG